MTLRPGILLVLDGWGLAPPGPGNAIAQATTPNLDALLAGDHWARLDASGGAVGLPDGVVGNSEIGHLVIGAGRPLEYDSLLVAREAATGTLRRQPRLVAACARAKRERTAVHLVGLCSDGQIHSHVEHFRELLAAAAAAGVERVWLHAIADGRDVADGSATTYLERLVAMATSVGAGTLASVVGRGYAMDKSGDLGLTETAYRAIVDGRGGGARGTAELIAAARASSPRDQWIEPTVLVGEDGRPAAPVRPGDVLIFVNFRSDRTQQLADMALERIGAPATGGAGAAAVEILSMTQYDTKHPMPALVPRADASGGLADELEAAGVRSVRIAEAEKFEHVTYYLNGRDDRRRACEDHRLIPGAAPDGPEHSPAMNVAGVAEAVAEAGAGDAGLVLANLANIDVVAHTGDLGATVRATEAVDAAVGDVCRRAAAAGRWVALVGDHGNGEAMLEVDDRGAERPYGGHTTNQVPFVVVDPAGRAPAAGATAALPAVAPTVLRLLGLPAGARMTAEPLV